MLGPLVFTPVFSAEARLTEGERTLLVYIRTDGPCLHRVFAVEAPSTAIGGDTPLRTLFAEHGHVVINEAALSYLQAVSQAQAYARRWQLARTRGGGIADCGCSPVPAI